MLKNLIQINNDMNKRNSTAKNRKETSKTRKKEKSYRYQLLRV